MNVTVLWGIISFLLWSTFSTWYYVVKIKGLGNVDSAVEVIQGEESEVKEVKPSAEIAVVKSPEDDELKEILIIEKGILFEKNRSIPLDKSVIRKLIDSVSNQPENRLFEIRIQGFTCDLGTESYNYNLGMKRAQNVTKIFEAQGVDPDFLKTESIGKSNFLVDNDSEVNRSLNRRVEVIIKSINP